MHMNMIVLHNSLPTIYSIDYMQYMRVKQVLAHAGRWHLAAHYVELVAMATHSMHLVQETYNNNNGLHLNYLTDY